MSTLQQYLKRPALYLITVIILISLLLFDSFRKPDDQITAKIYISSVFLYQKLGRPLFKDRIICRYNPSCSNYSINSVREFGIWKGLKMTYERINSCN